MSKPILGRIFVPESELAEIVTRKQTARIILREVRIARGQLILTSGMREVRMTVDQVLPLTLETLTGEHYRRAGYNNRDDYASAWAALCRECGVPLHERQVTLVCFSR